MMEVGRNDPDMTYFLRWLYGNSVFLGYGDVMLASYSTVATLR